MMGQVTANHESSSLLTLGFEAWRNNKLTRYDKNNRFGHVAPSFESNDAVG